MPGQTPWPSQIAVVWVCLTSWPARRAPHWMRRRQCRSSWTSRSSNLSTLYPGRSCRRCQRTGSRYLWVESVPLVISVALTAMYELKYKLCCVAEDSLWQLWVLAVCTSTGLPSCVLTLKYPPVQSYCATYTLVQSCVLTMRCGCKQWQFTP